MKSTLIAASFLNAFALAASAAPTDGVPALGLFGPALHGGLCSKSHVRLTLEKASAEPETQAVIARFLAGQTTDYADMAPGLAEAVHTYVLEEKAAQPAPRGWSSQSGKGARIGSDQAGDDVYEVHRKGGVSHWNLAIDHAGKVQAAYLCDGPEGLTGWDKAHPGPFERDSTSKP